MSVFADPNRLQKIPRSYSGTLPNGGKFRVIWNNHLVTWENYYAGLRKFLSDNGVSDAQMPSSEDVQMFICSHVPQGCIGAQQRFQHSTNTPATIAEPCYSCGKRF